MEYQVRLVVRPRSPEDVEIVLGELGEIGEVTAAEVTVDVHLLLEAPTAGDASNHALRLVKRAVTYAEEVWQAETPEPDADSG